MNRARVFAVRRAGRDVDVCLSAVDEPDRI